jgi:hypothetical protein
VRRLAVAGQFLASLIAFSGSALAFFRDGALAPLKQCEIVLPALADGDTDARTGLVRDDAWGFLGGALFLPAGGTPLFVCGRSTGLSATSTTITANCGLPSCTGFLPGT